MKALITGITGMDASHLAKLLLDKGYEVYGMYRRNSSPNFWRLKSLGIEGRVRLVEGDITDASSLARVVEDAQPDEVYNLAAQSHVGASFKQPTATVEATGIGALSLMEVVRQRCPRAKMYQAGSSEQFGNSLQMPPRGFTEDSPMRPSSPYACAKKFAFDIARVYREAYGMFIANGLCFNHEGPLRGIDFVTRKVTDGVARIKCRQDDGLELGNLDAERDWGYSPDYCEAMYMMLQQDKPEDWVIATGERHSVQELVELAFGVAGLDWREHVGISEEFKRPLDVKALMGDASKAREGLGWQPQVKFEGLVRIMVEADMDRWQRALKGEVFPWDVR